MKKIFYLLILPLCLLPFKVKAADEAAVLTCTPTTVARGGEFVCELVVSAAETVTKVEATIDKGDYVDYSDTTTEGRSENTISLEKLTGIDKVSIYLKVKTNAPTTVPEANLTVTLSGISINEVALGTSKSDEIRVKSIDSSLDSLSIEETPITLSDPDNNYSFNLASDKATATVEWTIGHSGQTVVMNFKGSPVVGSTVSGLVYGNNVVTVVVTAEDGTTKKTYTLTIIRPDNRSTVNTLSALTIESSSKSYSITFAPETTSYTVNVTGEVTAVTINATKTDTKAKFVTGYGPGIKSLEYGKNTFLLKVESEKGTVKTYTIVINRADNRSVNTYLKSLELSHGNLTFDKEVLTYTLTVPYTVTNITIAQEAEDTKSNVTVTGGKDLVVGENIITIKVTAENGMTAEYKITVTRQEESAALPSSNTYLSKLDVANYNLDFSKTLYSYTLTIKSKDKSLSITTATEDPKASYRILNNENLIDGSQVKIRVTAEDGTTKDYILNIKVKNPLDVTLLIAIGTLGLGVIVLIVVIILRGRGNKNNGQGNKREITSSTIINRENYNTNMNNATTNQQTEDIPVLDEVNDHIGIDQKITFTSKNG